MFRDMDKLVFLSGLLEAFGVGEESVELRLPKNGLHFELSSLLAVKQKHSHSML